MAVLPLQVPDRFNAATFFVDRHVDEGRGGKTAFFCEDTELTYGQLQEMVNRAGNALRELGVEAEQRVLCLLLDTPAFLATFWGAIKIGAIPIPINTMMRSQDYLYFLNDSRAKVAVISEPLLAVLLRVHGLSQRRRAPPARHGGLLGHLCAAGSRHHGARSHVLGGQALL